MTTPAQELLAFIEKSPSCFHAVANIRQELSAAGFTELFEDQKWTVVPGGKYFVVRNGSSIISFAVPSAAGDGVSNAGGHSGHDVGSLRFVMTSSHSDSPCFKVKENPELNSVGFVKLNVEKYGGMLLAPWFDRPLSLAGRVVVPAEKLSVAGTCAVSSILVNLDRDLLMIPNLAIHMNRDANDGHTYDVQNELMPVISSNLDFNLKKLLADQINGQTAAGGDHAAATTVNVAASVPAAATVDVAASVPPAAITPDDIMGYDLFLYNRDKGTFWGADSEFISSPRLDDLECAWTTLKGFLAATGNDPEQSTSAATVRLHCVFDNEEVGSQSRQGAASTFLQDTLRRINNCLGYSEEQYYMALAKSFMVSADNAHSVHPNYVSSADPVNRPVVNGGPVIKYNASQKYTSDSVSGALFKQICQKAEVPFQVFTNNSNIAGGSTLGNISTSQVSVLSVDIGLAQWAMHSPMESAGAKDVELMIKAVTELYSR